MATDNAVNQVDGLVITDDYLPTDEKDTSNNNNIELQPIPNDEDNDNKEETELYNKLNSLNIDTDTYDELDQHNFSKILHEHNIDQDISDKIFNMLNTNNMQSFITIDSFISWKNDLSIQIISQLLSDNSNISSPPSPDFVSPIANMSINMEDIDEKTAESNTTLIQTPNDSTNEIHITTNTSPIDIQQLEEEKHFLHQPYLSEFTENEYATKRCIRPVRNNVFMEKTVDECNSAEINFEVERLICCLHFLCEEYNIYQSLKDYLGQLGDESKANDISSPFAFSQNRNRKQSQEEEKEKTFTLVKRSNTAHHIKWLHEAYVTEREKRISHKKLGTGNAKPPNFNNVIEKRKTLKQMYEYLTSIWRELLKDLTLAWQKEHPHDDIVDVMDINHQVQGSKAQQNLIQDLKNRLKKPKETDIIKKMSTFTSEEEWSYAGNEEKYDPLFESTPTVDEMVCYETLCNVIFNDSISSHNLNDIGDVQKIQKAFGILRANDHAIASKTCGWVTTIDNLLSVLLYRDLSWYNANFIGELRISLLIESNKSTKLNNYENKALLKAIKQSIVYAFCGVPMAQEAQDNVFDINYIILRHKKTENNNLCSCVTRCCGQQAHLARLTFGILCDDSKPITVNTMSNKFSKQFPYKFLYQSKRLFEQIYRNKFIRLFDSSCRKERAQAKCTEIHTYDLTVFEYPKYEMDQILTQQFAQYLPNTYQNDNFTSSNELMTMTLRNYESTTIKKHIQQQEAVENYFLHSFDTSNLVEFADTIIEEDYGVMIETRIVNVLNAILSLINPTVVYSRPKKDKDMNDIGPMGGMDRGFSNSSDAEVNRKKGHKICCGHCFLSFGMIAYAIVMSIIVGIGGLNIWLIGQAPMKPTIENILGFTQKMIAAETEYVAERALFSTRQFIDFTNVLPDVIQGLDNEQVFDMFLDNTLITSPRFDGIIQIKSDNVTGVVSSFIFKKQENKVSYYDCNIDTGNCDVDDLYQIGKHIWDNRNMGVTKSYTNSYFIANNVINEGMDGGSIWFITWRYMNTSNVIIGAIVDSYRINEEYASLTLAKEGIVYWITNDEYKDIFATSLNDRLLYIHEHSNTLSSINLNTTFGYAHNDAYKTNEVDQRIRETMDDIDDTNDYYLYSTLQNATFGSFYTVIVFPRDTVYERLVLGKNFVILFTILAVIFGILNACIANAVPLVPYDDSWLATPLFTEEDKRKLEQAVEREKAATKRERRQGVDPMQSPSVSKQSLPAKLAKTISKKAIFKPMKTETIDFPLSPITQSVSRNKSENMLAGAINDDEFNQYRTTSIKDRETYRQRSNSDRELENMRRKKNFDSKADAINKIQRLADNANDNVNELPLKKGVMDEYKSDDDDDGGPPTNFGRAVSVATGIKSNDKPVVRKKKETKEWFKLWKKSQQKKQLQKNIANADMRSIFSREESKYKTKYGQRVNTTINIICLVVALFVIFAYLTVRQLTESDIETIMESYLNVSNIIMENHAEFKVYQHELALLEGQILVGEYEISPYNKMYNDKLLSDFYHGFDGALTGIFSFKNDINNLSLYGTADDSNECVEIYDITESYLATCIVWKRYNETYTKGSTDGITDCVLYKAIYETYKLLSDSKTIAWSVPFPCFGNVKGCYVAITKSRHNSDMYIGTLLSFYKLADTAYKLIWEESGMEQVVTVKEETMETSYTADNVLFSFYVFTHSTADDGLSSNDYLLSVTGGETTTTLQTIYGIELTSIILCNDSTNDQVRSTYAYLNQTSQLNETSESSEPVIVWSSWSYPKIVYAWYENDNDITFNWRLVITISGAIFLGDHNVYNTLGSISVIGWVIIYLFIHFLIYRRFEENITYWEELYWQQVMQSIRNLTVDDNSDDDNISDDIDDIDDEIIPDDIHPNMTTTQSEHIHNNDDKEEPIDKEEQLHSLEFISGNIRDTVRESCEKSWIRQQNVSEDSELPTKRKDITDHYHRRALRHIYQAKRGMNIITVAQMEKYGKSKEYRLKLYSLQSSRAFRYLMHTLLVIHILLVFWRPLTEKKLEEGYPRIALYIEIICLIFEFLDLILTFFIQFRWQNTRMNPLMSSSQQKNVYILRSIIWLLVLIDVILIVMFSKSFTRFIPLRPFLLILSNDKLIGACYALLITSINAADALLLFMMLLGMASISGVILFRFDSILMDINNVYSFQNMIRSIFTSYVFIISGENYGELVYVSFERSSWLILYFIICTVLGTWIVVSLVVSRFQTSFKQIYNKERQRRLYFKRTGYVAAFSLINLDNDNEVSKSEFEAFVRYIRHETDVHDAIKQSLQFEDFDTDGDDSIDIREFVMTLEEIYQKPSLIDIIKDDDSLLSWIQLHIVETEAFAQFVLVIILIEVILFALFGIYPGTSSTEMLDLMLGITVLLNGIDIAVKIFSMGWQYYWNTSKCRIINRHKLRNTNTIQVATKIKKHEKKATLDTLDMNDIANIIGTNEEDSIEEEIGSEAHQQQGEKAEFEYEESVYTQDPLHLKQREFAHRFDLVIVSSALIVFAVSRIILRSLWFSDTSNTVRIVMVIPLLRLFTLIKTTRSAVYIITKVIPRFVSLIIILLLLFYAYAVIGVWLIGDDTRRLAVEPQYSFETFPNSLVTLFQLTVGEGWHDIMYDTVYAKNSLLLTTWYFITFVLIITLIFTNLFVGLVISVVDDVEIENKTKYGQLRKDYKQQQQEEILQKSNKQKNRKKKTTHKQQRSNLYS